MVALLLTSQKMQQLGPRHEDLRSIHQLTSPHGFRGADYIYGNIQHAQSKLNFPSANSRLSPLISAELSPSLNAPEGLRRLILWEQQ